MKGRLFMRGHIAKKGNRYYVVVDIGTGSNRKQKWLSGFKSKKGAENELPKVLNDLNQGTYVEPSKKLYSDFIESWHKNKKNKVSKNTFDTYKWMIKKHIKPKLGDFQLSKLNSLSIDNFYTELEDEGKSSATIRKIHTIVRSSLEYAVEYQFISKNPAAVVKPPTVEHKDINVWDEKEMMYFLSNTKEDPYYIVYYLALWTGMRKGEILGLQWKDIDYENKKIRVMRSYTRTGFSKGKTNKARRVIDIDDDAVDQLKKRELKVKEDRFKMGKDYDNQDMVICRPTGEPIDVKNVNKRLDKLIENLEMKRIRFHDLRHTHATLMLSIGTPVKIVSERLGHAKVELTLNTYAHLLPSMQVEAVKTFSESMQKFKNAHSKK